MVVETSVGHSWMELPVSVSWLLQSHQGEVFLFYLWLKSNGLSTVFLTRDSSYECGIKARSQVFPFFHTSLSSHGCAKSSLSHSTKANSILTYFFACAVCLFCFLFCFYSASYSIMLLTKDPPISYRNRHYLKKDLFIILYYQLLSPRMSRTSCCLKSLCLIQKL